MTAIIGVITPADTVPAPTPPPTPAYVAAAGAGVGLVTASKFDGTSASHLARLNHNSRRLEVLGAVFAIANGLSITLPGSGRSITIQPGQAYGAGLIELSAAVVLTLPVGDGTRCIWLQPALDADGVPVEGSLNSSTPPAANCVFLGTVTISGGNTTVMDYSGVVYSRGNLPVRATADPYMPTDAPGSGVLFLQQSASADYLWDGSRYVLLPQDFDIARQFDGAPTASQVVLRYVCRRPFTIPVNAAGSQGYANTEPSASTAFSLLKNGASFGTATFSSTSHAATFAVTTAESFAAGDVLTIAAPAAPNAIADLAFNLAALFA